MTGQTGVTCKKCGEAVTPGAKFCMGCGSDVSGQQGGVQTAYMPSATQQFQRGVMDALRDATLGDYEVLAELGQGGMAAVFLAHDIALDRKVAIKVMSPHLLSGEGMVDRFKQEARTAAGLSHPHIIPIYAVKQVGDLLFFVMKFIEGRALDEIIKEAAPLPEQVVRQVISKVAEALALAHRGGVIHRDIKPANIMIDTEGTPIVTDFGIAKVTAGQGLTMTGATIGTPTYMSPEQCNALPITGASDQYSLGVMAYEMLTGRPLFDGESVMTIMFKHVHEEPPQAAEFGRNVNAELAEAVRRMLHKEPDERFPNMEGVASAFQSSLGYDSPERKALVSFAMKGENRTILANVKTPRSPFPSAAHARPKTVPKTGAQPAGDATTAIATAKKRRGPLVAGLVVALAGAAGAGWYFTRGADAVAEPAVTESQPVAETRQAPPTVEAPPPSATPAGPGPQRSGPAPVVSVRIDNSPGSMQPGQTGQLSAAAVGGTGQVLSGRAVTWRSNAPGIVSVTPGGQIRAAGVGTAVVTAASEGVSGAVTIVVQEETVAAVALNQTQLNLETGGSATLTVRLTGSGGGQIERPVTWNTGNPGVATVNDGVVTAVGPGATTITAQSGGPIATASVTVTRRELTEAEHRQLVTNVVMEYGQALQAKDIDGVRRVYPSLTSQREQQLRQALPPMEDLTVTLSVGGVRIAGTTATASVTGNWAFRISGRSQTLPANNTYTLRRDGDRWFITDIQ